MAFKLVLQLISLLWVTNALTAASQAMSKCQDSCGNVIIPYPFGIGEADCFMNKSFEVSCDLSSGSLKPFLKAGNLEIVQISLEGQVFVKNPVISTCNNSEPVDRRRSRNISLEGSPFFFSKSRNIFTAMSCDNLALITKDGLIQGGCMSRCSRNSSSITPIDDCFGIDCCQTPIPSSLQIFNVSFLDIENSSAKNSCKYAFLVEELWLTNSTEEVHQMDYVPVVLDWGISTAETCDGISVNNCGQNAECMNLTMGYGCKCKEGYRGNPYLESGCQDVDECADLKGHSCPMPNQKCINSPGSYNCSCLPGYQAATYNLRGAEDNLFLCFPDIKESRSLAKVVALATGLGVGLLFILLVSLWSYQVLKKRRNKKVKEKFFKRNGGLLLQQQVSSDEGNIERTKIFSAYELEKATDHYNENRILGQGGQGTVYKGMLLDGRIVAIKKSKIVNEGQIEQFINEVVILSHINHKNVVKLLGCCLETEVPLLVYEFISNGTLFHHIHDQSEEFQCSWDNRLRIAIELANALAYLHSAASIPIYHRDIKSTNILLDSKYTAKVSDFGISRSVPNDKTHLTTLVQGTFGYLDPEYFQSSQFTEKSDVYSFGVVLVELLTGEKPISPTKSEEKVNLATYFLSSVRENHLFDILDAQVIKEGRKKELKIVANLAKRCLNLNGRKRPTMKEVALDLEGLRMRQGHLHVQQYYEEECIIGDPPPVWDVRSISTKSQSLENSDTLSLDVNQLLFNEPTSFMVNTT